MVVNASASHNTLNAPEQTHRIAIDLSINSCWSFYKIYCSNIKCLIIREVDGSSENSLDHDNAGVKNVALNTLMFCVGDNHIDLYIQILSKHDNVLITLHDIVYMTGSGGAGGVQKIIS